MWLQKDTTASLSLNSQYICFWHHGEVCVGAKFQFHGQALWKYPSLHVSSAIWRASGIHFYFYSSWKLLDWSPKCPSQMHQSLTHLMLEFPQMLKRSLFGCRSKGWITTTHVSDIEVSGRKRGAQSEKWDEYEKAGEILMTSSGDSESSPNVIT